MGNGQAGTEGSLSGASKYSGKLQGRQVKVKSAALGVEGGSMREQTG